MLDMLELNIFTEAIGGNRVESNLPPCQYGQLFLTVESASGVLLRDNTKVIWTAIMQHIVFCGAYI